MNKETNKLIPELRFPEFINDGEWDIKPIGKVFNSFSGGTPSTSEKNFYGGKIPFIRSAEINKDKTELFLTEEGLKNSSAKLIEKGDLLVALYGANSGDSAISKINGAINQAILCLQSEFSNSFTYNFLTLKKDWIVSRFIQGGQGNLSGDIVKSISIPFPKKDEQQKIASCLSSLDEVIAAHSQKLELLKEHKKGLMQNLFPQEGETVPKLRFKEFVKDGEWIQTTVEDNCLVKGRIGYRGYTTQDLVSQGEGALVLGGKHIQNQMLELKDPTYLSWEKYYESPEIMVEVGDIIFSQRGTLGDCAIIDREIGPATINPSMVLLKNITCDASFLYYILIGDSIQVEVKKNMAMGAIPMLSQKQIREFPFLISKNTKEQQKIASCLSSLDGLITAQTEKIEQLKEHKKGLMQGLFPMNVKTGHALSQ